MKNVRFVFIAAAMIAGFITTNAQTADDIIKKHVDAIGGLDKWKNITSVKISGIMNFSGTEIPVTITVLNGKGYRMDMTMNGMANYMILTPDKGWMYFPIQGQQKPEAIPDEMVKEEQDQLDVTSDPLIDYKAKGNKVVLLGKDDVEGTECYKLKVTDKGGKETTMYLDATTYNHIRSVEKSKANGQEQETTANYSNYQKLPEGIIYPMSQDSDDGPLTIKTIEINKPVNEAIFKPSEEKK
jgi:hypothetical protein